MGDGLFKRGHVWFAHVNGKRISTGCRDKQAAAKRRDVLERRAADPSYAAAREATGERVLTDYAKSRRRLGRSEGTMHHVRTKAANLLALMPEMVDDWDLAAFEAYVDKRLEGGVARTTIKKELRVAKAALRHAQKHKLFERDPESVIPELDDDYEPRKRFLTPWELVALVTALDEENDPTRAAHVVFIVATGARWAESLRQTPADVGWLDGQTTHLVGTKTKAASRDVPTLGVAASLLGFVARRVRGGTPHLPMFCAWPNVRRSLLAACAKAKMAPVSPNDLRRTYATWLQQAGAANELIAKVMGHTTTRMTERVYGRITSADVARLLRERVGSGLIVEGAKDAGRKDDGERQGACEDQESRRHGGEAVAGLLSRSSVAAGERSGDSSSRANAGLDEEVRGGPRSQTEAPARIADSRREVGAQTEGPSRQDGDEKGTKEGRLITGELTHPFWSKVEKTDTCWLWTGMRGDTGYGLVSRFGVQQRAHRVAWELANGEVPGPMQVLHKCDVPACVRPDHLFLGTPADNMLDKRNKGRAAAGEQNGSAKLTLTAVAEIRAAVSESISSLARRFGVDRKTIRSVLSGQTWTGSYTGSSEVVSGLSEAPVVPTENTETAEKQPNLRCPETESNCRHGDFQASVDPWVFSEKSTVFADTWVANGERLQAERDLARFSADAAWDVAVRLARADLIAKRRFLPQFVGGAS